MSDDTSKSAAEDHILHDGHSPSHEHAGHNNSSTTKKTWLSTLGLNWLKFGASWIGITGLWNMTNVCPICGQPACPTGFGFAGLIGLLGAAFLVLLRKIGVRREKGER